MIKCLNLRQITTENSDIMKQIRIFMLLLVFLCAAASYAWDGDDGPQSPYLIASESDWNELASQVAAGNPYEHVYFELTKDISVSTMIGSSEHPFGGSFDGGGHTLTVNSEQAKMVYQAMAVIEGCLERAMGDVEHVDAYYTYQVKNYDRYELASFPEPVKRQYREEHWENDLQKAFDAGRRMAEKIRG